MAHYQSQIKRSEDGFTEQPLLTSVDSPTIDHAVSQKISTNSPPENRYTDRMLTLNKNDDTASKTKEPLLSSNMAPSSGIRCGLPSHRGSGGQTGNAPGSLVGGSAFGGHSPLLASHKHSDRKPRQHQANAPDDANVSDVDSSMERYKVRQNRNYERKAQQRIESSRSKLSTEPDKKVEQEIRCHTDRGPVDAERTHCQTSQQSEDLDPKFTQPAEAMDGHRQTFQKQPEVAQAYPNEFSSRNFENDTQGEYASKGLHYQTVNSRDFVLSNSVAQIDDTQRNNSKNKSLESQEFQGRITSFHNAQTSAPQVAGMTSEEKPSASIPNSDQKIPLSGLTSSIPLTDLDLSAQSRLMNTQQTNKPFSNVQQRAMQPTDDQNEMNHEAALDFYSVEQNTLQSHLGATSTLKDEVENLQYIQLNMPMHDNAREAGAIYGYGNSAFEGTMGVPSGYSRQVSNYSVQDGPIQMSTGIMVGGLNTTLRTTDDRALSSMCNDAHMMQDSRGLCYHEQTMKINENSPEGGYEHDDGGVGEPLIVNQRQKQKNITEYTDGQSSVQAQIQSQGQLRANTSRQEGRYIDASDLHRPSTILQVSEGLQILNTWEGEEGGVGLMPSKAYPSHHAIMNQELTNSQGLFANIQGTSEASGTMTPQYPQIGGGTVGARSLNNPKSSGQNSRKNSRASSNGGHHPLGPQQYIIEGARQSQEPSTAQGNQESYYVTLDIDNPNRKSSEYRSYVQTNQPPQQQDMIGQQQQPPNFQVICFIGAKPDNDGLGFDSKRPSRAMTVMSLSSAGVSRAHSRRPTNSSTGMGGGLLQRLGYLKNTRNSRDQQYTDSFVNSKVFNLNTKRGWFNRHAGGLATAKASQERSKPPSQHSRRNTIYGSQREHERFLQSQRSKSHQSSGVLTTQPFQEQMARKQQAQGRFFTTTNEISSVIFKQNGKVKNFIKPQLRQVLLRNQSDIEKFIVAATKQIKTKSQKKEALNLRQYQFDLCLNSEQHTASSIIVTKEFLAKKMIMGQQQSPGANSVVILFGSEHTLKSRDMSPTSPDSYMKKLFDMLSERKEPISLLRAHMYLQDKVVDLLSPSDLKFPFTDHSGYSDYKRVKQLIVRALQTRSQVLHEMRSHDSQTALLSKTCSHVSIQINNYYIIELGDLEGLAFSSHPDIIRCLADDFGSMTNEILRQSLFYQNYEFYLSPAQKQSQLNRLLHQIITKQTKISLFTYLSANRRHDHCSLTALDFAHKLRQYFYGSHDFCRIPQILQAFSESPQGHLIQPLKHLYRTFDSTLDRVDFVQRRIEEVYRQVQRLREVVLSRKRIAELNMQKEAIVREAREAVREVNARVTAVEGMRVDDAGQQSEAVLSRSKLEQFKKIIAERVQEIQSSIQEVENILHLKSSGRNESATIFTTFGDEDTVGDPSIEGRHPQNGVELPQREPDPSKKQKKAFNSQELRQDLQRTVQQTIKHSNSANFLHQSVPETIDQDEEKLECNQGEDQLLGPYLESSLTPPDGRMQATPRSPLLQHYLNQDCNSKDFYLLNESVHRGIFNELVSHSTQRLNNQGGGGPVKQGMLHTEQMQSYRITPPQINSVYRTSKQKEPSAQSKKVTPPMVLPARKVRSTVRLGGRQASIIHQPLAVKRPKKKKVVLNTMSVGRPTFSSKQRLLERQRENNTGSRMSTSPHPPSFGANKAHSQSVTSRKARVDEGRLVHSKSKQMSKKKLSSVARSAKITSSNKRKNPRRLQIMPVSHGSQASCRRVINITIDPDHAREHQTSSHSPVPPSRRFYNMNPQHTSSLVHPQHQPIASSNPIVLTASPHPDTTASRPVQTFATFPSHDQLMHQNTSYLLSMNYSQTSASGATPAHAKMIQVETVRRGRTMTGFDNSAPQHHEKQFEGLYRSYQVKEDYQHQNPTISVNESGKRQGNMAQGTSSRSRSNCEASRTQQPGYLQNEMQSHSRNGSKSAEAMPSIAQMKNQRTPPLSTRRVSNSQDLQEVLLAEEILRNKLGLETDQQVELTDGIKPYRSYDIRLETEPLCQLKQVQSQDAFQQSLPEFNDIGTNTRGSRTVTDGARTVDPQLKILSSDLSVQHEKQGLQQHPTQNSHNPQQSLLDFVACENQLGNEEQQQLQRRKSEMSNANLVHMQDENQYLRQLIQSLQEENQALRGNQEYLAEENNLNKEIAENDRIKEKLLLKYQRKLSKAKVRIKELRSENESQKRSLQTQQEVDYAKQQFKALKDQMQSRINFLQQKANQAERLNGELSIQGKRMSQELEQAKKELKTAKVRNQQYLQNKLENEGRDERIGEIKHEYQRIEAVLREKEAYMKKLKSRISTLEQELATAHQQQKRSRSRGAATPDGERRSKKREADAQKREQRDAHQNTEKEEKLQRKLTLLKKRYLELEGELENKDTKIEQVSKARDKYREQVLVLKQEIKLLKKELGQEMSSVSLTEDSILATDRDDKNNNKFEELLMAQNLQRKNQALQDMHKYLRELSPDDLQFHSQVQEKDQGREDVTRKGSGASRPMQLCSRELESSSRLTESVPNESNFNIHYKQVRHKAAETPQPGQTAKSSKLKQKSVNHSQKSIERITKSQINQIEMANSHMSREARRDTNGSRMRHDSQRSKGGVVFETQPNDDHILVGEYNAQKHAPLSSDYMQFKAIGSQAADAKYHNQDFVSKHDPSFLAHKRNSSKRETAQRTRIDSASSQDSCISDDEGLDGQRSFFHDNSLPVEDTSELLRSNYVHRKEINKTVLDQQERSMLISKKIVDKVTDRIMAKLTKADATAGSYDQQKLQHLVPRSQEDLTSSLPSHSNSMSNIKRHINPDNTYNRQTSASNLIFLGPQSTIDSCPHQTSHLHLQWADLERPKKKKKS